MFGYMIYIYQDIELNNFIKHKFVLTKLMITYNIKWNDDHCCIAQAGAVTTQK